MLFRLLPVVWHIDVFRALLIIVRGGSPALWLGAASPVAITNV